MSYLNNPSHWLERAEETRAKAATLWNEEARQRMIRIAVEYERLASHAAERARSDEASAANGMRWHSTAPADQFGRWLPARHLVD